MDKALEYYIRSLKIYETLDNKEGIATTKNNIATIYSIKGDYGQAMKYLEESYNQLVELKDESRLVGSLNNLGNLHIDLQLYEKASVFSKGLSAQREAGATFADPMNNLGNVFFRQGVTISGRSIFIRRREIEQKENNRLGMLGTITNIGIAYTKANQPKPAIQYLTEAHTMAADLQTYRFVPDILRNKADNQFRLGDVKSAYKTLLKYDSAREKYSGKKAATTLPRWKWRWASRRRKRVRDA